MLELIKKKFILEIKIKYFFFFKKTFVFKIKQASLFEIIEFDFYMQKSWLEIIDHIFNILQKLNPKFKKRYFKKIKIENFKKILNFIIKSYCKNYYKKPGKKINKKNQTEVPVYSMISFIIEHSNETIESLLNQTWEAIEYIFDWIERNINEQSKDWKLRNKQKILKKELKEWKYDKSLERIKSNREKILNHFKNKKW